MTAMLLTATTVELDPWDDLAEILDLYRPESGWDGPADAELAVHARSLQRTVEGPGGCLLSTYAPRLGVQAKNGGKDHRGVSVGGRKVYAHVLAFAVANGLSLAEVRATGLSVLHSCDRPACLLPEHHGLGSHQQTTRTRPPRAAKPSAKRTAAPS